MDKITLDIAVNNTESIKSLKDIKDAVKLLKSEALNVGEGGPGFTQLTEKAGQLQDKLNDVNDTIRVLSGNSIENFNKSFTNLASTAVGAFGAIEGAQALFGEQSEELQKTLVKLQALMNLSNGIREFANIGQAAKDFKVVLASLIPTLFTQTAATEGAAVAQTGLNAAMRANPIAAVFGALTLLVGAIVLFTNKTDDATESQELNTEQIEKAKKEEEDYKKSIDDTNLSLDDRIRKLDDELAVLGKNGVEKDRILTQQDAENRKRELLADKNIKDGLAALERLEELRLKGYLKTTAEFIELKELESSELVKIGLKAQEDLSKIEQLKTGKISEINKQASEEAIKKAEETRRKLEEIANRKAIADFAATQKLQENVERQDAIQEEFGKTQEEIDKRYAEIAKKNSKLTSEQIYTKIEKDLKALQDLKIAGYKSTSEAIDKEVEADFDKQLDAAKKAEDIEKARINNIINLSGNLSMFLKQQNQDLNSNFISGLSSLSQSISIFTQLGTEEFKTKADEVAAYVGAGLGVIDGLIQQVSDNTQAKLNEDLDEIDRAKTEETNRINKSYEDGLISKEEYDNQLDGLDKKSFAKTLAIKKKAFEEDKKFKIASASVQMLQGAVAAYTSASAIPPPAGQIIGGVLAGAVVALGSANIAKIKSTKFDGGVAPTSGPAGGGDISGSLASSAEKNVANGQFLNVGNFKPGEDVEKRVYVVESDITGTQRKVQVIENRSTY